MPFTMENRGRGSSSSIRFDGVPTKVWLSEIVAWTYIETKGSKYFTFFIASDRPG